MSNSNNAPKCVWRSHILSCGSNRQFLYVNDTETPWFIITAEVRSLRTDGERHGLWGAGMSDPHWRTGARIAACFGSGRKIAPLKHRAEQMALNAI